LPLAAAVVLVLSGRSSKRACRKREAPSAAHRGASSARQGVALTAAGRLAALWKTRDISMADCIQCPFETTARPVLSARCRSCPWPHRAACGIKRDGALSLLGEALSNVHEQLVGQVEQTRDSSEYASQGRMPCGIVVLQV
jgi:hypothetical protein